MKSSLIRALVIGAVSVGSLASAADLDLQKVYDVLQAPLIGSTKADLLKLQDGRIVATYGVGVAGLTPDEEALGIKAMEDCRQVAIRQAVLDATVAGDQVNEISRKNSHRLSYAEGIESGIEVLVGLKVTDADGNDQKRTYSYTFSDPEDGTCGQVQARPVMNDFVKKKDVESRMKNEIIPKFSDMERQARMTAAEVTSVDDLADKMVTKVFKHECEQVTLNRALELSALAFKSKFGSNPVVLVDWEQSRVQDGKAFGTGSGKASDLAGFWIMRMVDVSGNQSMKTQLNFNMSEDAAENCAGSIDAAVTELN